MAFYRGTGTGDGTFTNGDDTVTFGGTVNMIDNARTGEEIRGPDGKNYELFDIIDAQTVTIKPDYEGVTVTSPNWHVVPVQGYQKDLASAVAAAIAAMSSWSGLTVADGKLPQYRGTAWEMRSPTELLFDFLTGTAARDTIASSSTCDIAGAAAPIVEVTGNDVNTVFVAAPDCIRFVFFLGTPILQNNSGQILLSGAARNVTVNSWGLYISDALGVWREAFYGAHA
jgi:hypothetical protein